MEEMTTEDGFIQHKLKEVMQDTSYKHKILPR